MLAISGPLLASTSQWALAQLNRRASRRSGSKLLATDQSIEGQKPDEVRTHGKPDREMNDPKQSGDPGGQAPLLRSHMPELDTIRGLAILGVIFYHGFYWAHDLAAYSPWQRIFLKAMSVGQYGVNLFFVLSGFLITGILLNTRDRKDYYKRFYLRRALRILPAYYLTLLILVIFRLTSKGFLLMSLLYSSNLSLLFGVTMSYTVLWSLAVEEHFYLVWPLVVFGVRREALERICLAVVGAALALRIALSLLGMSELSISVLTPCRLDAICVGALLAAVARREGGPALLLRRSRAAALAAGGAVLLVSAFCAATRTGLAVLHPVRGTLYAVFFAALLLLAARPPEEGLLARAFQAPWLRTFGKYSYGLYIYQGILSFHMGEMRAQDRLAAMLGSNALAMTGQAVLGVGVSLALAALSYEVFEKRFLALKKLFAPGSAAVAPAAPQPVAAAEGLDRRLE